jgi:hypothetical protein
VTRSLATPRRLVGDKVCPMGTRGCRGWHRAGPRGRGLTDAGRQRECRGGLGAAVIPVGGGAPVHLVGRRCPWESPTAGKGEGGGEERKRKVEDGREAAPNENR